MNKPENKSPSIFQKILETGNALMDAQILKAKTTIINSEIDDNLLYSKAITEDPNYSTHSQGWKDKPFRIQNSHLKQMSTQDTAVAAVIQTRQNQGAAHSKLVKSKQEKGFMICLRDEDALLEKIKEDLKGEINPQKEQEDVSQESPDVTSDQDHFIQKADAEVTDGADASLEGVSEENASDNEKSDDEVEVHNWELERKAREKLNKSFEKAKKRVEEYVLNCGNQDNRPFETKRWKFDGALRALIRDSLTYDLYACETVPDRAGRPHHWFPVDGGTIKFTSDALKNYKTVGETFVNLDFLYPENEQIAEEKQKVIELDPVLLEKGMYRYGQIIKGRLERAYTPDELKVGIRNINTDIYSNGYGISELELLVSMVTGHLNAEYYNQAYFTQGFSAKGILHIKSAIPRRKLESVRQDWQAMVRGTKNAFQTPIFAGVDEVKWIPLTQNHNDIGFEGWMRYLITMISAIYQIDPAEMGIYFKQEGSRSSMSGADKTDIKLSQSKDKGLYPLMRHLEEFINENIIKPFDARFILRFTGMTDETPQDTIDRQEKEVKFKKTVNEIRSEDGLPPLPGCDDLILDPQYMAWYSQFSDKGMEVGQQNQQHQQNMAAMAPGKDKEEEKPQLSPQEDIYNGGAVHLATSPQDQEVQKSYKQLSVEVYKIEK